MSLPLPEYDTFDAVDLAGKIAAGVLSPLEVLEAALARADAIAPLNAFSARHDEMALETAKRWSQMSSAERRKLSEEMPLFGVPFVLKDLNIALKGTVTTNGCGFFKDDVADHDSTVVQRYKRVGLNIFGKTTSPEFGLTATTESRLFGQTLNPWAKHRSSGGSSGGSAVAVASGVLPMAHASDGGGSIRIPASHCGLFGLKPSRSRVPTGPKSLEGWLGLSVQHAISRSVRDSALLLSLTEGPEAGTRVGPTKRFDRAAMQEALSRPPKPLRIALLDSSPFGQPVHPDCQAAAQAAAFICEQLGHRVEPAMPQLPLAEMFAGMGVATSTGLLRAVRAREAVLGREAREDEFEPLNWRSLQQARSTTAEQVLAARAAFDRAGQLLDLFLESYDLILSPVTAVPAPLLGELALDQSWEQYVGATTNASAFTAMFNMSGHPGMSVPLYWNAEGVPVGAQFIAPFGDEALLISLAAELEQAAPWKHRRPPAV